MEKQIYDVVIVGGSFAGLSAALMLVRAERSILILDSRAPCYSRSKATHGFLTHDGKNPFTIIREGLIELGQYPGVTVVHATVIEVSREGVNFRAKTADQQHIRAKKVLLAAGVSDVLPSIPGLEACWGRSVFHCPYCQAHEVKGRRIGLLGSGEYGFERSKLISGWTSDLHLLCNGESHLSTKQHALLQNRQIPVIEKEILLIQHSNGQMEKIIFTDRTEFPLSCLFIKAGFRHPYNLGLVLGCNLTDAGYIQTDENGGTSVEGVFAAGDCTTPFRTVATSCAAGVTAAIAVNNELLTSRFIQ